MQNGEGKEAPREDAWDLESVGVNSRFLKSCMWYISTPKCIHEYLYIHHFLVLFVECLEAATH